MKSLLTFLLMLIFHSLAAQPFPYPSIQPAADNIIDFIPRGWIILDSAIGDLNKNNREDAALVIQYKDSISLINEAGDTIFTQPRILFIVFKEAGRGFILKEQSNSFIMLNDNQNMDDPYDDITITKGILNISFRLFYSMGSWYITNTDYKFRYKEGTFVLIGADKYSLHRASHDYTDLSCNFLTKDCIETKGNENEDKKPRIRRWRIKNTHFKTLKTFKTPFSFQVASGIYL
ncbi:MAG: hypothetical protein QM687_02620 [Ferruginibacter sp.]